MALIRCAECGRSVSDKAKTCPGCGRDVEVLKQDNCSCRNCKKGNEYRGDCNREYGLVGYPCLAYVEED